MVSKIDNITYITLKHADEISIIITISLIDYITSYTSKFDTINLDMYLHQPSINCSLVVKFIDFYRHSVLIPPQTLCMHCSSSLSCRNKFVSTHRAHKRVLLQDLTVWTILLEPKLETHAVLHGPLWPFPFAQT